MDARWLRLRAQISFIELVTAKERRWARKVVNISLAPEEVFKTFLFLDKLLVHRLYIKEH